MKANVDTGEKERKSSVIIFFVALRFRGNLF